MTQVIATHRHVDFDFPLYGVLVTCMVLGWLSINHCCCLYGEPKEEVNPISLQHRLGESAFEHTHPIQGIHLSTTGRFLALRSYGEVTVVHARTGKRQCYFAGVYGSSAIAISTNDKLIAVPIETEVRIHDLVTGKRTAQVSIDARYISAVNFADHDRLLITADDSGIGIVEWETQILVKRLQKFRQFALHEPMRLLAVAADAEMVVFSLDSFKEVARVAHEMNTTRFTLLAMSPDGTSLAAAYLREAKTRDQPESNGVCIYNIRDGQREFEFSEFLGRVSALSFSPDGKTLAVGTSASLSVFDLTGDSAVASFRDTGVGPNNLEFSRDGDYLLGTCANDFAVRFWKVSPWRQIVYGHAAPVNGCAFSPDESTLVTCSTDGRVCVWGSNDGRLVHHFEPAEFTNFVLFSPDGQSLVTAHRSKIEIRDTTTWRTIGFLESPPRIVRAITFSRSGDFLACADRSHVYLWNYKQRRQLRAVDLREVVSAQEPMREEITCLAMSPDSQTVAMCVSSPANPDTNRLFVIGGTTPHELQGHRSYVHLLRFASEGGVLVAATARRPETLTPGVYACEVASQQFFAKYDLRDRSLDYMDFYQQGRLLVTCGLAASGSESIIRVWQRDTGEELFSQIVPLDRHVHSLTRTGLMAMADGSTPVIWKLSQDIGSKGALPAPLTVAQMQALWAELAKDFARADRAAWRFVGAGNPRRDFLLGQIDQIVEARKRIVKPLIEQLDSPRFSLRQAARDKLLRLDAASLSILEDASRNTESPEVRLSLKAIISEARARQVRDPDELQWLRASRCLRLMADE